jgi:alpha-tubulin suppressor-like RCC1 family protein
MIALVASCVGAVPTLTAGAQQSPKPPAKAAQPVTWRSVSSGAAHSCALSSEGKAYCWGLRSDADSGARGDVPVLVSEMKFESVSAGSYLACIRTGQFTSRCTAAEKHHSCAITATGEAYCWGTNQFGQLGDGTTRDSRSPVRVGGTLKFSSISAGYGHTCGITRDKIAYCWGTNSFGELGLGSVDDDPHSEPRPVASGVNTIGAGRRYTCASSNEGSFCWGDNYQGRLGNESIEMYNPTPLRMSGGLQFVSISTAETHACGLVADGAAHCWGSNFSGEIGPRGELLSASRTPLAVGGPQFSLVSAGAGAHSCGIARDGAAYCWGVHSSGQLGIGETSPTKCNAAACSPTPSPVAGGLKFRSLGAGSAFTCGVTTTGDLYCWGSNESAQLGVDRLRMSAVPVRVRDPIALRPGG